MTIHQANEANLDGRNGLDLLRSSCSLVALVDSNKRYDPPPCSEATRRNIIQEMKDWVRRDNDHGAPSSVFWLHGAAGTGKSALAQAIAEEFESHKNLAATFFFKADVNRNNGDWLIPTLAHQLVQSFRGLTPFVEQRILQNPDLFVKSRQTQMSELLVEPLISLSLEETGSEKSNTALRLHPRLIVIDGLDECHDADTQCDLLRVIASAITKLPYPLRFLITSRPESHITHTFQHDVGKVAQYDLSVDSDADRDIRHFLEEEFANIRCIHPLHQHLPSHWPPRGAINSLVEQSSGHIIYPSAVVRFIQSPKHRPDDRLQLILGLKRVEEQEQPYACLDSLYRLIFLGIQDSGQLEKVHRALGIMHLRSLKSGLFALTRLTSNRHAIEMLLELEPGDIVLIFDGLLSLVTFDKDNIRVFDKSLFDYLLDSSRSRDLHLDLGLAHENAANYIVKGKELDKLEPANFQAFAYHCQFARLDGTLTGHLRSLACDSKIIFTDTLSRWLVPSKRFSLLQSILYWLPVMGRQDFDSTGQCYKAYVMKMTQHLRSTVPWRRRLKNHIPRLLPPDELSEFKGRLRSSFRDSQEAFGLKGLQLNLNAQKTPIPAARTSVVKSIEREHEMFSAYVEARYGYPDIAVSFLEPNAELIHSCHFVIRAASTFYLVTFVMLVTYTQHGVRLSCTEFDDITLLNAYYLVKQHLQRTQNEVYNNHITVYS